ncbi:MAG: hypothetical protein WD066_18405 [Planctomycetaceae bacterium]
MRRLCSICGLMLLGSLWFASPSSAEDAGFAKPPAVERTGDGATIRFEVDRQTDVEVTVRDEQGRVIRHLAAGVLGKNPPKPLQAGTLAQTIVWDGKDDAGRPAQGGPFDVRVAAGLQPELDGFLLDVPDASPRIHTVAVGPEGEVYAFFNDPTANGNQGGLQIKRLDRKGRHVKTVVPFPADLDDERVEPFGRFRDDDGTLVPRIHNWQTLSFYPDTVTARYRTTGAGGLPVVDAKKRLHWLIDRGVLASLDADGGAAYDTFLSRPLFPEIDYLDASTAALAIGGDGRHLYVSGLQSGRYTKDKKPIPAVYRVDMQTREKAELFLGDPEQPGREKDRFTRPRGIAVHDGLLFVADAEAGRIGVFREADGLFVKDLKLASPQTVSVHSKTGAIYVLAHTSNQTADLIKFENHETAKESYRLELPRTGQSPNYGVHRTVLDASSDPPRLWMPGLPYAREGSRLSYIEDTGEKLVLHDMPEIDRPWGNGPRDLTVDRRRGHLFVKVNGERWHQFDERTGELVDSLNWRQHNMNDAARGSQLLVDSEGNFVTLSWKNGLMRWDADGEPIDWPGRDSNVGSWGGMMTFQQNYMDIHNDELFVIPPGKWRTTNKSTGYTSLLVFGLDEKPRRTAVWQCTKGTIPRLDAKGNIYLATMVKPTDRVYPEFFDDRLSPAPDKYDSIGEGTYWYSYMYGSIVKFPAEGGILWFEDKLPESAIGTPSDELLAAPKQPFRFHDGWRTNREGEVQNAEWVRFGFAPYSETYSTGTPTCMCEGAGFAVDPFGRVFYPNLGRFRVEIVDTNNNPITTFGRYGNRDSAGPDSKIPLPGVPLAWPTYVAVSDTHAYVADTVNMRVAKVKLGYAAEATATIE